MTNHDNRHNLRVPSLSTTLVIGSAWLGFIAFCAIVTLGNAASTADVATRLIVAVAAAAGAVVTLRAASQLGETSDEVAEQLHIAFDAHPTRDDRDIDGRSKAA